MSQIDELLNGMSDETVAPVDNGHIVIGLDRYLSVPDSLKKLGVQYDHDVNTITFDCPRYWGGRDLSTMKIYANYLRPDGYPGMCLCENVVVDSEDDEMIHFDWVISGNVTQIQGALSVLVCAKSTDGEGNEVTHWNSELCTDMYVSEGMKCKETILRRYPDIITQLLTRMDMIIDGDVSALDTSLTERGMAPQSAAVGAAIDELKGKLMDAEAAISEHDISITTTSKKADEAVTVAKGKNRARVFLTTEDMSTWLSDSANAGVAQVGDNIYIVELNVPDWWISEVLTEADPETGYFYKIAQLETQKVDLNPIWGAVTELQENKNDIWGAIVSLQEADQTLTGKDTELQGALNAKPNIFYGTAEPSADLGKDGDLYFQYDE